MYSNSVKVLHDENDIEILKELIKSDWKKFKKLSHEKTKCRFKKI